MAIEINEFKLPITPQEACEFLQHETDSFGVFFDVERCFELCGHLALENKALVPQMQMLCDGYTINPYDKASVAEGFRIMGVPSDYLYDNGKVTLNKDTYTYITANKALNPNVYELVGLYQQFMSNKRNIGYLKNIGLLPHSVAIGPNGHRMSVGHPTWKVLSTSRISASNPGVQGVPRTTPDIIIAPKGYRLVRADSGQIEPRINFSFFVHDDVIMKLIIDYDDAYFGIWRYCTASEDELAQWYKDFEGTYKRIEVTDEIKTERQNIKTLTNAGSYGSSHLDKVNPALASAYDKRIVHHPARLALEHKIQSDVKRGVETFYGAFGTPVTPDSTEKYSKGSDNWRNHLVRCGINNPVQTTASELMMFSIFEARKILSRAKDSHVCYYKHDEACFYVSEEDVADGILDELSQVTAYNVKGWIPIHAEAEYGVKKGYYPRYVMETN